MANDDTLRINLRSLVGALPPNTALPGQRELCAQFDVTTFKLHHAIHELAREGLVTVARGKGIFKRLPDAAASRYVRLLYLENPTHNYYEAQGHNAFCRAAGRQRLECRSTHMKESEPQPAIAALAAFERDANCAGVVITGIVTEDMARELETVRTPFIVFGDVLSLRIWPTLPVVAPDNFQGGQAACEHLLDRGCTRLVLLNVSGDPEWSWNRETRAGAMAAAERKPDTQFFIPSKAQTNASDLPARVAAWLGDDATAHVGILCRSTDFQSTALVIRERLAHLEARPEIAALSLEEALAVIPGVQYFACPFTDLAEHALRRLAAMRHGADSPGCQRLPFRPLAPLTAKVKPRVGSDQYA